MKFRTFMSQRIAPVLIIALLLSGISIIVTTSRAHDDPCDYWLQVKVYWQMEVFKNEMELIKLQNKGYLGAASEGAWNGMIGGGAGAGLAALAAGGIGAVPAAGVGAVAGGIGTSIAALWNHRKAINDLKDKIKFAKEMLIIVEVKLNNCRKNRKSHTVVPEEEEVEVDPQGTLEPYMDSPTELKSGETHYALFSANVPFSNVYWYVLKPGESGDGTLMSTDTGDGTNTSSTFSYTPNTSGTFTIKAQAHLQTETIYLSYSITVPTGP